MSRTIAFSEIEASMSLFAEAISGRPARFHVVESGEPTWPLTFRSGPNAGEGEFVVPAAMTRTSYRSLILAQALADPATAAAQVAEDVSIVHELVDNHRVSAMIAWRFPGAVVGVENLLAHGRAKLERDESIRAVGPAWAVLERLLLGASVAELTTPAGVQADMIAAVQRELATVQAAPSSIGSCRDAADRICVLLGIGAQTVAVVMADEEDPEGPPGEDALGAAADQTGSPAEVTSTDSLLGGQPVVETPETVDAVGDSDTDEDPIDGLDLGRMNTASSMGADARTFLYDEWDYRKGEHRRGWCRVVEERLEGDNVGFVSDVRERHHELRGRIQRRFAQLRPTQLHRVYQSHDGEELDIDAAIRAVIDRRCGAPVEDRLHIRRDRAERDVATAFLVDLSASTSSPVVAPEVEPILESDDPFDDPMSYGPLWDKPAETEPVRRVLDVAKEATVLMVDALHQLGDQQAVYGFSGTGRDHVEFKIGKDFNDRVSPDSWAAIAEMKPLRYTRMGPAIRHSTAKLSAQSARTKLLVIISDGYPQDVDYGEDRRDRDYGIHDTARAIHDAADAGVDTFCVTIDPAGHDYLRHMCPADRYLVIDEVESLPEELAKLYLGKMAQISGR